jgi:WD40 repeat protein
MAALTPDGKYLAAYWVDGTVALVDIKGETTVDSFFVPNGEHIRAFAVSPDGHFLAAGHEHGAFVWDLRTRALPKVLMPDLEQLYYLRFSPDSKLLACTHSEGVALYDTSTFQRRPFERGDLPIGVTFSQDSRVLAYQANNRRWIRLWDISMNRYLAALRCVGAFWMEYSKDGKRLVAVTGQRVHIWNLAGTGEKLVLGGHTAAVSYVAFSPDGKLLATAGRDHKLKIWDPATGTLVRELNEFHSAVEGLSFSPDGRILAAANYDDGAVLFYDVASWKALTSMQPQVGRPVFSTAFSADGQYLAAAGSNGLTLWRVVRGNGEQMISFQRVGHLMEEFCSSICFSPDGNWLAWVDGDWYLEARHRIHVWDLRRSQPHAVSLARSSSVMKAIGFGPNGDLAFVDDRLAIAVWDVARKQQLASFGEGQIGREGSTHLSADGAWYAVVDQTVAIWDMAARKLLVALPSERPCSLGWSPNRKLLAVGGSDGSAEIWNLPEINVRLAEIGVDW